MKIKEMMKGLSLGFLSVAILVGYSAEALTYTTWTNPSITINFNVKYGKEDKNLNTKISTVKVPITGPVELYTVDTTDFNLVPNSEGCYFKFVNSETGKGFCIRRVFYVETDTTLSSEQMVLIGTGKFEYEMPYTYTPTGSSTPVTVMLEVEGIAYVDMQGTIAQDTSQQNMTYITLKGKIAGGAEGEIEGNIPGLPEDEDEEYEKDGENGDGEHGEGYDEFRVMFMGSMGSSGNGVRLDMKQN